MAVETEIRALLSTPEASSLAMKMRERFGSTLERRWFVDVSQPIEDVSARVIDLKLRVTNGFPSLAIKRGTFGAATREESLLTISRNQIDETLFALHLLGRSTGTYGGRIIERFVVEGCELSIHHIVKAENPRDIYASFVEVENLDSNLDEDNALKCLHKILLLFNLNFASRSDWISFVEMINSEWDGIYGFRKTDLSKIKQFGDGLIESMPISLSGDH